MPDYISHDRRFDRLVIPHAKLERLHTGCRWAEGPAYFPAGRYLLWSDIPNDRLMRFDETDGSVSIFASPCGHHNGHARDGQGRLVSCEHGGRCVSRVEHDGSRTVIADRWNGRRFNSPNDVVVKSDGSIWFTDPTYGIDTDYEGERAESEIGACNVYRWDPRSGVVDAVITDLVRPNGLAFSPDETVLYVVDTGRSHVPDLPVTISAYAVDADGKTAGRRGIFATLEGGFFDGLRVDTEGHVWTSAGTGVHCYAPDGTLIGEIPVGEIVANLCFGGPRLNRLYICAQTSLYSLFVAARGIS